jgi:hypothetical protein
MSEGACSSEQSPLPHHGTDPVKDSGTQHQHTLSLSQFAAPAALNLLFRIPSPPVILGRVGFVSLCRFPMVVVVVTENAIRYMPL